ADRARLFAVTLFPLSKHTFFTQALLTQGASLNVYMRLSVLSLVAALFLVAANGCSCGDPPPVEPDAGVLDESRCGDGVIDDEEECDGANLGGADCASSGFDTGQLRCGSDCRFDTDECSTCGNDVVEAAEVCDGADINDTTCAT